MNNYEKEARENHLNGNNCSISLYKVFKDKLNIQSEAPKPRSIDGKCGAILATEQILREIGKEDYIDEYEKDFLNRFKYVKCIDLMKNDRRCNDYICYSASVIEEYLKR